MPCSSRYVSAGALLFRLLSRANPIGFPDVHRRGVGGDAVSVQDFQQPHEGERETERKRERDREKERERQRKRGRQKERQTDRKIDTQTHRQADTQTERHTDERGREVCILS